MTRKPKYNFQVSENVRKQLNAGFRTETDVSFLELDIKKDTRHHGK